MIGWKFFTRSNVGWIEWKFFTRLRLCLSALPVAFSQVWCLMREPSDHLSRLAILNLNRKVHCVQSQFGWWCKLTFRLATKSKGKVCIYAGHSLFNVRPKFLPGRSRRVSFVANSILFNFNQRNPNPMTMAICSLDLCCVSPVYVIHLLHNVVHIEYSGGGSLRGGSLRSGSLGSGSLRGGSLG